MKKFNLLSLVFLTLLATGFIWWTVSSSNNFISQIEHYFGGEPEQKRKKGKKTPMGPYEEFMLQRIYPGNTFDTKAYKAAMNDAATKKHSPNFRTGAALAYSWQLEGPGNIGGRFNCVAVNPLKHDVMYAGSANGGVWKTNDNAITWTPVFDSIPYQAIGAITINPNDTSEIWVGTGDVNISGTMYLGNGLYKSNNSGITWSYAGLSDTYVISAIMFNPANSNEILVTTMGNSFSKDTNRGIYRSTNGGSLFTNVKYLNDSTGFIDMLQDPVNPSIVYATSFSRIRTDWTSLINGTEVYIFKSTDFGLTWNVLAGGLPNGVSHERLGITLCKSSPQILYALYSTSDGSTPQLYKSTDAGATWNVINIMQFEMFDYGSFGWYFGKIYCDPNNPDLLYIPGVSLQYSLDGGLNWMPRTSTSSVWVHADGHHMVFLSSNEIIYSTDGGLYRTYDGGFDWFDIENIPNNQFYAITENINSPGIYAGGVQDNGTMYGNASMMNSFTRIYGGDGFTVTYTSNASLIYSESQNGHIVYDDNFPNFFIDLNTDLSQNYNWHTPYLLSHFSEDTLYFGGQSVMRIDGAPYGSYTVISPVLHDAASPQRVSNISVLDQSKLDRKILYAGTADGKVWNTLDAGNNWTDITPFQGSPYFVTAVKNSPNNVSTAYVTRSGYRANDNTPLVFMSISNGAAWTSITGDLPLLAVNDIEIYPGNENIIFIANDAGVYYTTNGGTHWERLGDNMPFVAVLDIQLNFNETKLIAGTFGRSMYTIDVTGIVTKSGSVDLATLIRVYPNPVSDYLHIQTIRNIDGYKIYSSKGALLDKGKSSEINVSRFPAGSYYLTVEMNGEKIVRKFIKQ